MRRTAMDVHDLLPMSRRSLALAEPSLEPSVLHCGQCKASLEAAQHAGDVARRPVPRAIDKPAWLPENRALPDHLQLRLGKTEGETA